MTPDAWAEAEGWLASLNLLLARDAGCCSSAHSFLPLPRWISPEMLPQLSATHFGVAVLPAAFTGLFPNNTSFAVASDQLFPWLYALDSGLESTTWASSLQRSPLCLHSPTTSANDKLLWVTGRRGWAGHTGLAELTHGLTG